MDEALFEPRGYSNGVRDGTISFENCKSLERLSIRKARIYHEYIREDRVGDVGNWTLIHFVRNAPSTLRWFRSDLPQEVIIQYRLEEEYPNIKFLN